MKTLFNFLFVLLLIGSVSCSKNKDKEVLDIAAQIQGKYKVEKYEMYLNDENTGIIIKYPYKNVSGDEENVHLQLTRKSPSLVSVTNLITIKYANGQSGNESGVVDNIVVKNGTNGTQLFQGNLLIGQVSGSVMVLESETVIEKDTLKKVITALKQTP